MKENRSIFKMLTGTPTENRLVGRSMHTLEDNIRINLKYIGVNRRIWIDSAQDKD